MTNMTHPTNEKRQNPLAIFRYRFEDFRTSTSHKSDNLNQQTTHIPSHRPKFVDNSRPFVFFIHMNRHVIGHEFIISPAEIAETCTAMLSAFSAISAGRIYATIRAAVAVMRWTQENVAFIT